mmetsp:Transcript_6048/g.25316  ORF Transcript_6048/g.25316 Transcript_6048/m.25316 type:complete len:345 (+) Transcript_6048:240-1274(+)
MRRRGSRIARVRYGNVCVVDTTSSVVGESNARRSRRRTRREEVFGARQQQGVGRDAAERVEAYDGAELGGDGFRRVIQSVGIGLRHSRRQRRVSFAVLAAHVRDGARGLGPQRERVARRRVGRRHRSSRSSVCGAAVVLFRRPSRRGPEPLGDDAGEERGEDVVQQRLDARERVERERSKRRDGGAQLRDGPLSRGRRFGAAKRHDRRRDAREPIVAAERVEHEAPLGGVRDAGLADRRDDALHVERVLARDLPREPLDLLRALRVPLNGVVRVGRSWCCAAVCRCRSGGPRGVVSPIALLLVSRRLGGVLGGGGGGGPRSALLLLLLLRVGLVLSGGVLRRRR